LSENIRKNYINNNEIIRNNVQSENIIDKEANICKQIINNNFNNTPINNIFINNINCFYGFNILNSLNQAYLNNAITSNYINNIFAQNITGNYIDLFNNNYINNASINILDGNNILDYP